LKYSFHLHIVQWQQILSKHNSRKILRTTPCEKGNNLYKLYSRWEKKKQNSCDINSLMNVVEN
jgi:hypothetical protein